MHGICTPCENTPVPQKSVNVKKEWSAIGEAMDRVREPEGGYADRSALKAFAEQVTCTADAIGSLINTPGEATKEELVAIITELGRAARKLTAE